MTFIRKAVAPVLAATLVAMAMSGVTNAQTPSIGPKLGVGVFGGMTLPIVQDDQKSGTVFGFFGRLKLIPILVFEPNISFATYGDPDPISGVNLGSVGSKVTSFGIDAVLGAGPGAPGMTPFFFGGIGSYSIKNDDTDFDETAIGYSGGLGLGFNLGMLDLNVRGRAIVIPLEDGGSKKSASATVGLSYVLGK